MKRERNTRPKTNEEKWVDYDDETACWGIFGTDSGFCYSLHLSEQDVNDIFNRVNNLKNETPFV